MGQTQSAEILTLDANIRDWVVLPMLLIMIFVNLLRHYVQQLMRSDKALDINEIKHKQTLTRASLLRRNGNFLTEDAFKSRKGYFNNKDSGRLLQKVPKGGMNAAAMMNPMAMLDMMKGNITFIVPNMAMMAIINQFFQGFVLVKVPFSLTNRFKTMLHRGVDLDTLDVSYVSSLSWYFLLMFGLRGLIKLILGEDSLAMDESRQMQAQMGMGLGAGGGMGQFNAEGAFKNESEQLNMTSHKWVLHEVEKRLLGKKWPASRLTFDDDDYKPTLASTASKVGNGALKKQQQKQQEQGAGATSGFVPPQGGGGGKSKNGGSKAKDARASPSAVPSALGTTAGGLASNSKETAAAGSNGSSSSSSSSQVNRKEVPNRPVSPSLASSAGAPRQKARK
mmetsp:Transcript_27211/g.54805  ORF Transcript_27211/g.54805 Transcript_27211/m.54805 type:complete len:393 (-) Transcript_27211:274-1452(-)